VEGLAPIAVEVLEGGRPVARRGGEAARAPPRPQKVGGWCWRGSLSRRWRARRSAEEVGDERCGEGRLDGQARGRPTRGRRRPHSCTFVLGDGSAWLEPLKKRNSCLSLSCYLLKCTLCEMLLYAWWKGGQAIDPPGLTIARTWRAVAAFRPIDRPVCCSCWIDRPKCAMTDGKAQRFMEFLVIGCCVRWQSHGSWMSSYRPEMSFVRNSHICWNKYRWSRQHAWPRSYWYVNKQVFLQFRRCRHRARAVPSEFLISFRSWNLIEIWMSACISCACCSSIIYLFQ
jgi:hypothetical protein